MNESGYKEAENTLDTIITPERPPRKRKASQSPLDQQTVKLDNMGDREDQSTKQYRKMVKLKVQLEIYLLKNFLSKLQ